MDSFEWINQRMVAFYILLFNVIGNFGNFHIIYLTWKRKELRSKSAFLQCASSFCHSICLLLELFNAYFLLSGIQLRRDQCYPIESSYILCSSMQSVTMLMMQLDIVFLVILPLRYRLINTTPYVIKMLIPGFAFGIFFAVWGWLHVDEEVLIFCNPPVALVPHISHIWMASNLVVNSFVLCLLVVIIVLMYTRGKQQGDKCRSDTQQIVLRLKVISAIFVFSWYSATLGHTIINSLFDEGTLSTVLSSNMIFFALIIFSQSFYVILWRSREYRKAFFSMYSENFLLRRLSSIGATVSSSVPAHNSQVHS